MTRKAPGTTEHHLGAPPCTGRQNYMLLGRDIKSKRRNRREVGQKKIYDADIIPDALPLGFRYHDHYQRKYYQITASKPLVAICAFPRENLITCTPPHYIYQCSLPVIKPENLLPRNSLIGKRILHGGMLIEWNKILYSKIRNDE